MIDFLTRMLFESLPWLLAFCVAVLAVALAIHRTRYTKATRRGVWVTLAACVGLVVLQRVVVTDREALQQTVRTMARAVDEGDVGTIADHLDADFRLGDVDRDEFIHSVNRTLQVYQIDNARIFGVEADVTGDVAAVRFGAYCDVRRGDDVQHDFPTQWRLRFVRRSGRWLLERIERAEWRLPIGDHGGDIVPYFR